MLLLGFGASGPCGTVSYPPVGGNIEPQAAMAEQPGRRSVLGGGELFDCKAMAPCSEAHHPHLARHGPTYRGKEDPGTTQMG